MLNARLAAAESMTHDVIRDLLGVKLDMTNYAVRLRNSDYCLIKHEYFKAYCSFKYYTCLHVPELNRSAPGSKIVEGG